MPEGHSIHRYATKHREELAGEVLDVTSPQGRFAAGASHLNGQRLEAVDPLGKHLFYRWSNDATLHIQLGLFGRFRLHRGHPPEPTPGTRLAMSSGDSTLYLSGPTICRLIEPDEESNLRARIGPDPLGVSDPAEFIARASRRRTPVGAVLLDQKVISGIGNVYRAELLFLVGLAPQTPVDQIGSDRLGDIWDETRKQLRAGARAGRIITVDPADVGLARRSQLNRATRLYVYGRTGEPCRRCSSPIRSEEMAGRKIWWCPSCQPR